jgi:hypothetical protein
MKKTILSLAFVAMGVAAFAQKPVSGDMTLESRFSLDMGGPNGFFTPTIRYRYFLMDDLAIRATLGITSTSNTQTIDNGAVPPATVETGEIKTKGMAFGIAIGAEKHLAGTEKLSPYFGAELNFGMVGAGMTDAVSGATNTNAQNVTASGSSDGATFTGVDDKYETTDGGATALGVRLIFGADYYFTNSIYIGGEMGWGFMSTSQKEQKVSVTSGGVEAEGTVANEVKSSTISMMNFPAASIRFGIKF